MIILYDFHFYAASVLRPILLFKKVDLSLKSFTMIAVKKESDGRLVFVSTLQNNSTLNSYPISTYIYHILCLYFLAISARLSNQSGKNSSIHRSG